MQGTSGDFHVEGYEIEGLLGLGQTGELWLARQRASGQLVGLKRLHPKDADAHDEARRIHAVLGMLNHSSILPVRELLAYGTEELVLVLDHAEGGTLEDLLMARPMLDPGEIVTIGATIAHALGAVHEHGLTHGDITPESVVFTADGRPMLTNVGLSALVERWDVLGPSGYTDPSGDQVPTTASDIYGLAAVSYTALSGSQLDPSQSIRPLHQVSPGVPAALSHAIGAGLQQNPSARPDAAGFAGQLDAAAPRSAVRFPDAPDGGFDNPFAIGAGQGGPPTPGAPAAGPPAGRAGGPAPGGAGGQAPAARGEEGSGAGAPEFGPSALGETPGATRAPTGPPGPAGTPGAPPSGPPTAGQPGIFGPTAPGSAGPLSPPDPSSQFVPGAGPAAPPGQPEGLAPGGYGGGGDDGDDDRPRQRKSLPWKPIAFGGAGLVLAVVALVVGLVVFGGGGDPQQPTDTASPGQGGKNGGGGGQPQNFPPPELADPAAEPWAEVYEQLDVMRAEAYESLDTDALGEVYVEGSAPWQGEVNRMRQTERNFVGIIGLRAPAQKLAVASEGEDRVVLEVTSELQPHDAVSADGSTVPVPHEAKPLRWRLELVPGGPVGWLIDREETL